MTRTADEEIIPLRELEARLSSARAREAVAAQGPAAVSGWERDAADIDDRFADLLAAGIDDDSRDAPVAEAQRRWRQAREAFDALRGLAVTDLDRAIVRSEEERRDQLEGADGVRREARLALLAPLVIGLGVAGFAGRRFARHVLVPLRILEQATDRLAHGELSYRVDVRRRDELGTLAAAFNDMAADLERGRAQLTHQALHDPLTGLANRTLLSDRMEHGLGGARRRGATAALLRFDLDGFKTVHDSLGHQTGDRVLVTAAEPVTGGLPTGDTAARLGGDEFAVLLEDVDAERALGVAEQINALLRAPFALAGFDGKQMILGASVGLALSTGRRRPTICCATPTSRCIGPSSAERGAASCTRPTWYEAVVERLGLEAELQRGVKRGEFTLLYQPTVELATGLIVGCEALVRWQHPERGAIPPLQFIPLAEETGLIVPLGGWVLREACDQAQRWRREHPELRGS